MVGKYLKISSYFNTVSIFTHQNFLCNRTCQMKFSFYDDLDANYISNSFKFFELLRVKVNEKKFMSFSNDQFNLLLRI